MIGVGVGLTVIAICIFSRYVARVQRKQARNADIPLAEASNSQGADHDNADHHDANITSDQPPPSTFKDFYTVLMLSFPVDHS